MADIDLADLRKQCITSLYLCTDNISKYLDSEKEEQFDRLRTCVQQYCTVEAQQEVAIAAMEKVKEESNASNLDSLEDRFKSHLSTLVGKRLRIDKHPYMTEYNKRVQKGLQSANANLDESDIAITESQDQYIDPITKRPIADPVRNTKCGHIYDKESMMKLIQNKHRTKCPVAGCGNREYITQADLIEDEEVMFRMKITQHSTMIQQRSIMDLDDST